MLLHTPTSNSVCAEVTDSVYVYDALRRRHSDNMGDDDGRVGDQFFRNVEQVAAYVPYMVSIGNHEDKVRTCTGPVTLCSYQPLGLTLFRSKTDLRDKTSSQTAGLRPSDWFLDGRGGGDLTTIIQLILDGLRIRTSRTTLRASG